MLFLICEIQLSSIEEIHAQVLSSFLRVLKITNSFYIKRETKDVIENITKDFIEKYEFAFLGDSGSATYKLMSSIYLHELSHLNEMVNKMGVLNLYNNFSIEMLMRRTKNAVVGKKDTTLSLNKKLICLETIIQGFYLMSVKFSNSNSSCIEKVQFNSKTIMNSPIGSFQYNDAEDEDDDSSEKKGCIILKAKGTIGSYDADFSKNLRSQINAFLRKFFRSHTIIETRVHSSLVINNQISKEIVTNIQNDFFDIKKNFVGQDLKIINAINLNQKINSNCFILISDTELTETPKQLPTDDNFLTSVSVGILMKIFTLKLIRHGKETLVPFAIIYSFGKVIPSMLYGEFVGWKLKKSELNDDSNEMKVINAENILSLLGVMTVELHDDDTDLTTTNNNEVLGFFMKNNTLSIEAFKDFTNKRKFTWSRNP